MPRFAASLPLTLLSLIVLHASVALFATAGQDREATDSPSEIQPASDRQDSPKPPSAPKSQLAPETPSEPESPVADQAQRTPRVRKAKEGEVEYRPPLADKTVAERFRLDTHRFRYVESPFGHVSDYLTIAKVTFPSPVTTKHLVNNTVHCEYYRPTTDKPVPAVVVLHILGGDFELSRLFCNALAHHGVAALFLKMPYYGPRRDPNSSRRMISPDPNETVAGMTQAVLDIRRAVAWLESREEVAPDQLGIFGISLGGITAALATTAEPRLEKACLLLAGGDLGKVAIESPRLANERRAWQEKGGSLEEFKKLLGSIDPVRYASNAQKKKVLMLNAKDDEVIPRSCTDSLWKAFGKPEIVWYSGGHYSVAFHMLNALDRVTTFFQPSAG